MIKIQLQRYDPQAVLGPGSRPERNKPFEPFGDDGLTFRDLIDLVNPLQHLPFIGGLYRKLTGDTIDPGIRVAGGALFGGAIGAAVSAAVVAVSEVRGGSARLEDTPIPAPADDHRREPDPPQARRLSSNRATMPRTNPEKSVGRHDAGVDDVERDPTTSRQIRRGGWMVVQAYGETYAARAEETQEPFVDPIDVAV